ncbi:NACHT, LRR and PYD domains-containing protein 13 [Molossus molossus]|uniref:NACHT, LRR and PYD domains-containing protein 13 n=1 Tax=Molossus molossus TaxID=27622 RepID=UPI0017460668|nr:NACHT, LRR and PYD domains-containing protein 13 [Molossus molossus]
MCWQDELLGSGGCGGCISEELLSHLRGLDQYQLERFKLGLQSPQVLAQNSPKIPWANVKAADPRDLLCLMKQHFPERQVWEGTLRIFEDMNLTPLCEGLRAQMNEMPQGPQDPSQEEPDIPEEPSGAFHRGTYRERMKAKFLAMWNAIPWPKDHIYLRNVTEQEHKELRCLLYPKRMGAQPQTIVLHGVAGVGKTTLAMKVMMHWAEGLLFQQTFLYVFYTSCHQVQNMEDTTLAGLLSRDWPDSQAPIEHFMSHPERLLFVIDGFEDMTVSSDEDDSQPCTDWYQQLPAARILIHLLKKKIVPEATLLITTRDCPSEDLKKLLLNPWFILIPGFTEEDQEEYFFRYFRDRNEAKKILRWIRKNEALSHSCSAPLVCWTVSSCLKWQMARRPSFQLSIQTTTSLYAYFFSSLFESAEVGWSKQSWSEQWKALCSLAADGMWSSNFTFAKEDMEHRHLQPPLIDCLFRLNILRKVSDCEDCMTFTHQSFQVFLGAMFYVLRGKEGAISGLSKHQELRVLLNDAFVDTNSYWHQMALFSFGLLNRDLARQVEDTLHCKMSPRVMDEFLRWAEALSTSDVVSCSLELLPFFQCVYETQEETFVKQILSHLLEADLEIGDLQLQVTSFCLKHCQRLSKLRLSVRCLIPQMESTCDWETPGTRLVNSKIHQWQDVCSVFHNGNVRELDLSNSKLNATSMKKLCYELRNPRCKLQKLTCKSITPVRVLKELVLVLHGNNWLTHLNLSSNNLGVALSMMLFRTLRHSACNLKYLWLESCGLTSVACHGLFLELSKNSSLCFLSLGDNDLSDIKVKNFQKSFDVSKCALRELSLERCNLSAASSEEISVILTSTQRTVRLCLGFNQLQDDGVRWLCASLSQSDCVLERLVLCFCQLGAPSCRHLSDALLQNRSLTHLTLKKNHLGDEGVRLLCEALSCPDCRLQSLNLSQCSFTVGGCQELAGALQHNRHMKVLDIGRNCVQDDGVKRLCEVLKWSSCTLNTLGLEKCNLTSACCQHLSSVLGSSKSLENLNLLGNDLGPEGVNMLWKSLQKSTCKLQKLG